MKVALFSLCLVSIWAKVYGDVGPMEFPVKPKDQEEILDAVKSYATNVFNAAKGEDIYVSKIEWDTLNIFNKELLGGYHFVNTDENNEINLEEFTEAVKTVEIQLIKKADANNDKELNPTEYGRYKGYHQYWLLWSKAMTKEDIKDIVTKQIIEIGFEMNQLDGNKSALTTDEYKEADFAGKTMLPGFSGIDGNNNGDIDMEEFKKEFHRYITTHAFTGANRNNDAELDKEESADLRAYFQGLILLGYRSECKLTEDEVKEITFHAACKPDVGVADKDKDGKLNDEELKSLTMHSMELIKEDLAGKTLLGICNEYFKDVTAERFKIANRDKKENGDKKQILDSSEFRSYSSMFQSWAPHAFMATYKPESQELKIEMITLLTPCYTAADINCDGKLERTELKNLRFPEVMKKVDAELEVETHKAFAESFVKHLLPEVFKKAIELKGNENKLSEDKYLWFKTQFNNFDDE